MDLSAIIFVVLALAWAVYLIPKALQHHDEMASDRLVEGHSDRVRILRRKSAPAEERIDVEATPEPRPTRTAGQIAARRRRRVLALLLLASATVAALAYFLIVPWWSTAIPGALILVFLVVARLSVRKAKRASLAQRRPAGVEGIEEDEESYEAAREPSPQPVEEVDVMLADPAMAEALSAKDSAVAEVLADDGSLWDPLPLTLPTYVNKARARRTVRTIELTGMHSSGHDEADSALARETDVAPETTAEETQRRVAGA